MQIYLKECVTGGWTILLIDLRNKEAKQNKTTNNKYKDFWKDNGIPLISESSKRSDKLDSVIITI